MPSTTGATSSPRPAEEARPKTLKEKYKEIRAQTITEWQTQWSSTTNTKGCWTRLLIPNVESWLARKHGTLTYHLTEVLTGHGKFQQYIHRIRKSKYPRCRYCLTGAVDDPTHTVLSCPRFVEHRVNTPHNPHATPSDMARLIESMLLEEETWIMHANEMRNILEHKSKLEAGLSPEEDEMG